MQINDFAFLWEKFNNLSSIIIHLVPLHYFLFDSHDRGDAYKCERDFTSTRDINERSRGHRKIFAFLTNTSVKRTAYYINPLYLSSLFLPWCDMAEIVGAARKRKFDNHRFNFQCARARATPTGRIVEGGKKNEKKNWSSFSLSFPDREHARDRRTTRARSRWRRHGLKWRVKWPLLPRAKYSKSPILSLFCLSSLHIPFPLKMLAARHIACETNNRENKKIELLMPLWRGVYIIID